MEYIAAQDQVVDDANDAAHGVEQVMVVAAAGVVKVDGSAIAQQASGQ